MKKDSLFRIKDMQMNQLDEEVNDLFALVDDTEQEIQFKLGEMEELRTQLKLYDPNYKTEMEKVKRSDTNKYPEYPEEEIPF